MPGKSYGLETGTADSHYPERSPTHFVVRLLDVTKQVSENFNNRPNLKELLRLMLELPNLQHTVSTPSTIHVPRGSSVSIVLNETFF